MRFVGYVAGGRPGQRLLARLSIATSDDTVLRRVRQEPEQAPTSQPIRNLGLDDWAWRKGQEYGTILVNLDLRRPGTCYRNEPRKAFPSGSSSIRKSQPSRGIAADFTPKVLPAERRKHSRSRIASISS